MSSRTGFLKLLGFTGVGLAQPKVGMWAKYASTGIRIVPMGSMCLTGFRVIRPSILAVGSPQRLAIQACADSWKLMANTNTISSNTRLTCCRVIGHWPDDNRQVAVGCRTGFARPGWARDEVFTKSGTSNSHSGV